MRKFEDRIDNDYSAVVPICSVNTLCAVFLYFRVCSHNRSTQRMGPGTLASIAEPIRGFGDNELRGQLSTPHQSTLTPSPRVANSCRARLTRIGRDSARRNQNIGEINTRFHHVSVCGRGMSHYVDAASHCARRGIPFSSSRSEYREHARVAFSTIAQNWQHVGDGQQFLLQ